MSEQTEPKVLVSPSLPALLFVLFLGLKLTGHIDWAWYWVFAPLWVPVAFIVIVLFTKLLAAGIVWLAKKDRK